MPHYAKCDVISRQNKIQTEMQQNVAAQKYKRKYYVFIIWL